MANTFTYDRYRNRIGQGTRVMDAETGVTGKIAALRLRQKLVWIFHNGEQVNLLVIRT